MITKPSTMVCSQCVGTEMPRLRFPMRCSHLRAKAAVPNCFVSHPHPLSRPSIRSPRLRAPGPAPAPYLLLQSMRAFKPFESFSSSVIAFTAQSNPLPGTESSRVPSNILGQGPT